MNTLRRAVPVLILAVLASVIFYFCDGEFI